MNEPHQHYEDRFSDAAEGEHAGGGGHGGASGRWLVSYADFITLMMVVFMVLYSMARVDNAKFGKLKASLQASSIGGPVAPLPVGGNPVNTAPTVPGPDPTSHPGNPLPANPETAQPAPVPPAVTPKTVDPKTDVMKPPAETPKTETKPQTAPETKPGATPAAPPPDPLTTVRDQFRSSSAARAGQIGVEMEERGVVVSVVTSLLFAPGQAELKPEGAALLDQISKQLKTTSSSVLVEGAPDSADKDAPWDLASRRAGAVVGYLVNKHGLAPDRFAVIGYGKGAGIDGLVNVVVLRRDP